MGRKTVSGGPKRKLPPTEDVAPGALACPIVGIGSSVGGLEACTAPFRSLPADTGMAFVLVQHLDPDHESLLARLLSRATAMWVTEAVHGTVPKPNCVYVIPPGRELTIAGGLLRLSRRREKIPAHMPIDGFFCSLARDQGQRAIGVVLSGASNDGTSGLEAIKGEGGITFAQAVGQATGHAAERGGGRVRRLCSAAPAHAAELARIARHSYVGAVQAADTSAPSEETLRKILVLLDTAIGADFTGYKHSTILRLRKLPVTH